MDPALADVIDARSMYEAGDPLSTIAAALRVRRDAVEKMLGLKDWRQDEAPPPSPVRVFTREEREALAREMAARDAGLRMKVRP